MTALPVYADALCDKKQACATLSLHARPCRDTALGAFLLLGCLALTKVCTRQGKTAMAPCIAPIIL